MGTQRYSITGGTVSENGNAWVTVDYMQRNSVQLSDRDFSASADQTGVGGYDFRSSSGNPGSIKILPGSENGYESGFYQVPAGSTGTPTAEEIIGAPGINRFDYNPWMTLTPEYERSGASSRINYTLTDYATAFVHTTYRNIKTHQVMAPTPAFGDLNTDTWGILPASNAFNPFGEDTTFRHRLIEVGPRLFDIESDVFRVIPGVKFDIGDSWQGEAAFLYNKVESIDFGRNFVSSDALKEALASSDPATAYNIFGAGLGINSPSVLDALRVNTLRRAESELRMFDVKAAGDLWLNCRVARWPWPSVPRPRRRRPAISATVSPCRTRSSPPVARPTRVVALVTQLMLSSWFPSSGRTTASQASTPSGCRLPGVSSNTATSVPPTTRRWV